MWDLGLGGTTALQTASVLPQIKSVATETLAAFKELTKFLIFPSAFSTAWSPKLEK